MSSNNNNNKQEKLQTKIRRIHCRNDLTPQEKAKMIQSLLSKKYHKSQDNITRSSDQSVVDASTASTQSFISYHAEPQPSQVIDDQATLEQQQRAKEKRDGILGCKHYRRGCQILAECCGKYYPCRFCHDDAENHAIIRYDVQKVACMKCNSDQPFSSKCVECGFEFGRYVCNVCKFIDDMPGKHIYHCDKCRMCRIGKGIGIDYFHCDVCSLDMPKDMYDSHQCMPNKLKCNCPICAQYLFTSVDPVQFMSCGHPIHSKCYSNYVKNFSTSPSSTTLTCPLCKKSILPKQVLEQHRIQLEEIIASIEMPTEFANTTVKVLCNDCNEYSTVPFHFYGNQCGHCKSFNTSTDKIFDYPTSSTSSNSSSDVSQEDNTNNNTNDTMNDEDE